MKLRHPKETKGENYDATSEANRCCDGGSCCWTEVRCQGMVGGKSNRAFLFFIGFAPHNWIFGW